MNELEGKIALVVDDESPQVEFISAILDDIKMKTISAGNGKEASEKMKETKPDVIFLDLMMPEQSGMKFFHELKKNDDYKNIPVIVVSGASKITGVDLKSMLYDTTFSSRKEKVFGTGSAPDAYLEKPVDPDTIIEIVRKYLAG
jgi:CheY-like chemotaxis protein